MKASQGRQRITIIGLGLIGGSLGLAIKGAGLERVEIVGHDRERGAENEARRRGAVDRAEHSLPRAVRGANLIIIATPVLAVAEVMQQIAPDLSPGAVVTDTASTKAQVMEWAARFLPPTVHFIGGHPMAGKETPGIKHAEASLFRDRAYCLCPSTTASEAAISALEGLTRLMGAVPVFMDPEEHDQYVAAVSHMPLILSTALFTLVHSSPAWPEMAAIASSGFRDLTRLASGDPRMSHDICVTNREAIIHWLERVEGELRRYRNLLQDAQDDTLYEAFARAQAERDAFMMQPPSRLAQRDVPNIREELLNSLILGGWVSERLRRARELPRLLKEAPQEPAGAGKRRPSLGDRIAEGVRRDLERLEREEPPTHKQ